MNNAIIGEGDYRYIAQDGWAKWPEGWDTGDVAAVGVDRHDNVYAFNRSPHPMVVFDRDGNFLRSWGEGVFKNPHGVYMGLDDTIFLNDDGDHTMRQCTLDGKVLMTIGIHERRAFPSLHAYRHVTAGRSLYFRRLRQRARA